MLRLGAPPILAREFEYRHSIIAIQSSQRGYQPVGNRLTRIYTRTGDDGTTGLVGGVRIAKSAPRVEAMGTVDELNCCLGIVFTHPLPEAIGETLTDVQHTLFDIGGELAMPGTSMVEKERVDRLESALDHLNADLPPLKEFILPGGGARASAVHLARAVCRRAERVLVELASTEEINPVSRHYVNRLSDYLFVAARTLARADEGEVYWKHERKPKG
eukprot:XP_003390128.1 PREDICTED: uncharacterized protein LOC100637055 [Amphimedon queenslandica]